MEIALIILFCFWFFGFFYFRHYRILRFLEAITFGCFQSCVTLIAIEFERFVTFKVCHLRLRIKFQETVSEKTHHVKTFISYIEIVSFLENNRYSKDYFRLALLDFTDVLLLKRKFLENNFWSLTSSQEFINAYFIFETFSNSGLSCRLKILVLLT